MDSSYVQVSGQWYREVQKSNENFKSKWVGIGILTFFIAGLALVGIGYFVTLNVVLWLGVGMSGLGFAAAITWALTEEQDSFYVKSEAPPVTRY